MSNYSYVVSRSNVSILLTTLSNRTNPLFVANIKDENSTRHTSAITIVNNWHTSIAHSYGRVRHNAAPAASFLKPPSRRREEIASFAQWYMSNHSYVLTQLVKLSKSATCCKHTRLQLVLSSPEGSNLHSKQRSEPLTPQLAHSRPLTLNRKMKKYTPDAPKPFPNFIVPARRHGDCLAF